MQILTAFSYMRGHWVIVAIRYSVSNTVWKPHSSLMFLIQWNSMFDVLIETLLWNLYHVDNSDIFFLWNEKYYFQYYALKTRMLHCILSMVCYSWLSNLLPYNNEPMQNVYLTVTVSMICLPYSLNGKSNMHGLLNNML